MIWEKARVLHADLKDTPGMCAESGSIRLVGGGSINLRSICL